MADLFYDVPAESFYVIRNRGGLYWAAANWVGGKFEATQFPNSDRQNVRLSPGESWEKLPPKTA